MSKRQKHGEICYSSEDRISQLPDEILVTILSHVTLREAATTSILSRRWKELWTFTRSLEFDAPDVLVKIVRERDFDHAVDALFKFGRERDSALLERKRYKYSIWVNQILKSHKGASIDGFRIRFDMDNSYKSNIDTWINFAIQKSVLRLEVDLKRLCTNQAKYCYPFPKQVLGFPNIKFLRCLLLNYVDVSGPDLEELLSKCPSLEALSVSWSISLVGLKVCGASLKLKFIEIRDCQRLKYVEVSAGNLMALTYSGPNISLRINHAPKLGCMYLGGCYCKSKFPLFCEVYTFFSQIETFVLDYGLDMVRCIPEFPQFTILKHLELTVRTTDKDSLLSCISLIKACPMLHRLAVQFEWCSNRRRPRKLEKREGEIKCLKVLEFRWFSGLTTDVELAVSLLENAPNLDKITFDTRNPHDMGTRLKFELDAKRRAAKVCARQLAKKYAPLQAKLLLI